MLFKAQVQAENAEYKDNSLSQWNKVIQRIRGEYTETKPICIFPTIPLNFITFHLSKFYLIPNFRFLNISRIEIKNLFSYRAIFTGQI